MTRRRLIRAITHGLIGTVSTGGLALVGLLTISVMQTVYETFGSVIAFSVGTSVTVAILCVAVAVTEKE